MLYYLLNHFYVRYNKNNKISLLKGDIDLFLFIKASFDEFAVITFRHTRFK